MKRLLIAAAASVAFTGTAFAQTSVTITDAKATPASFSAKTKSVSVSVKAECSGADRCIADVVGPTGPLASECTYGDGGTSVSCTVNYDISLADRDAGKVTLKLNADAVKHAGGEFVSTNKDLTVSAK